MSSEDISLIASEKFIQKFVYAIIQNIRAKNFTYDHRDVIHAEMVPRMSERTMQASMVEKVTAKPSIMPVAVTPIVVRKKVDMSALVAPISRPRFRNPMPRVAPRMMPPVQVPSQAPISNMSMMETPSAPKETGLSQDYGKITALLNDPSVSTIECSGAGKPLMIIRAGQKQGTRISLTAKEIKEILHKVSDVVHIPLLEGVFRAAVDNFSINAVISEMIGSRFIIKKQTAYALLER